MHSEAMRYAVEGISISVRFRVRGHIHCPKYLSIGCKLWLVLQQESISLNFILQWRPVKSNLFWDSLFTQGQQLAINNYIDRHLRLIIA